MKTIYVVCHSWPNQDGYSVMPSAFKSERAAMKAAQYYAEKDNGVLLVNETQVCFDKHGYAVKPLDME